MPKPEADPGFGKRLRLAMSDYSIRDYARACAISPAAITKYLNGTSEPGLAILRKMAQVSDVDIAWLATGDGKHVEGPSMAPKRISNLDANYIELVELPPPRDGEPAAMTVSRRWVESIGATAIDLAVWRVPNDWMEPSLGEGGVAIIDRRKREITTTAQIFAVMVKGNKLIARVQLDPFENNWDVLFDNEDVMATHQFTERQRDNKEIEIVGRVIRAVRNL